MMRTVEPETLDQLAETDPRAIRSRLDLRRVNRVMGTLSILLRAVDGVLAGNGTVPRRVAEIGAGDGSLLLRLARQRTRRWPRVTVTFVDRQAVVAPQTQEGLASLGWQSEVVTADVFAWLCRSPESRYDLIVANLFLHHFEDAALSHLLAGIAARTHAFVACEPRRAWLSLAGSHLLGLLGCNDVTRRDAVLSVRAGFNGTELTSLWPPATGWRIEDGPAGMFTQVFTARNETGRQ